MASSTRKKPDWVPNDYSLTCERCMVTFTMTKRRHHCRGCGHLFCADCCSKKVKLPKNWGFVGAQRVCDNCAVEFKPADSSAVKVDNTGKLLMVYWLRDKSSWKFMEAIHGIGRRAPPHKTFGLVQTKSQDALMTTILSSRPFSSSASVETFKNLMGQLAVHPYISNLLAVDYDVEKGMAIVVKDWLPRGSLRDMIHKAKPNWPFQKKYAQREGAPIDKRRIPVYGRQILETLQFLRKKGIPYPHLHASNVMIVEGGITLCDIENSLLSLEPLYLNFMSDDMVPEVLCFAHVLFQMSTGFALRADNFADHADKLPKPVYAVLQKIFKGEAKTSVADLLELDLFANVKLKDDLSFGSAVDFDASMKTMAKKARLTNKKILRDYLSVREEEEKEADLPVPAVVQQQQVVRKKKATGPAPYGTVAAHDPLSPEARQRAVARAKRRQPKTATGSSRKSTSRRKPREVEPATRDKAGTDSSIAPTSASARRPSSSRTRKPSAAAAPSAVAPVAPTAPAAPVAPAAPAAPTAPAAPSAPSAPATRPANSKGRGALLSSIENFSKGGLKKAHTVDKSEPKLAGGSGGGGGGSPLAGLFAAGMPKLKPVGSK